MRMTLSIHSVNLLLSMIGQFTSDLEGVDNAKEMIWRFLLLEIQKGLMAMTIEVEEEYQITLRPYQVWAVHQLLEEIDLTDQPWDDYQFHLFKKMEAKISFPIKLGTSDYLPNKRM